MWLRKLGEVVRFLILVEGEADSVCGWMEMECQRESGQGQLGRLLAGAPGWQRCH